MKIDFHVHGKITNKFPFDKDAFLLKVEEAKNEGLAGFALTEHCHSPNFMEGNDFLRENYKYINDYYDIDGFRIFYGMEVGTFENLDILIIGNREKVIDLKDKINSLINNEFIKISNLFNLLDKNSFLVVLAHPYRHHDIFPNIDEKIFTMFDAIEINASDLIKFGMDEMKNRVIELGNTLQLPIVGGGDAHHFMQIGSITNNLDNDCKTVNELKDQIKLKKYNVEISPNISIRVRSAHIIKKLICNK
jgi:hypothetical protein